MKRTSSNTGYQIDSCFNDLMRHQDSLRRFQRGIIDSEKMLAITGEIKDAIVGRMLHDREVDRQHENRHPFERVENHLIDVQLHVLLGDVIQRIHNSEVEPSEDDIREDIYRLYCFAMQF